MFVAERDPLLVPDGEQEGGPGKEELGVLGEYNFWVVEGEAVSFLEGVAVGWVLAWVVADKDRQEDNFRDERVRLEPILFEERHFDHFHK